MHPASPWLVGAAAGSAALIATIAVGGSAARRLGAAISAACSGHASLAITASNATGIGPAALASSATGIGPSALASSATGIGPSALASNATGIGPAALASNATGAGTGATAATGVAPSSLAATSHTAVSSAALSPAVLGETVLSVALPILGATAVAAVLAHLAQTRAAWLPRRRIAGAPVLETGPVPRTRRAAGDLAAAAVIGAVSFGWLWWAAPRLAGLVALEPLAAGWPATPDAQTAALPVLSQLLRGAASLLIHLGGALAVTWIALGALDALARHAGLARALAMTTAEKREDDRLTGADPRWRSHRAAAYRGPSASDAVAGASVLLLGDDVAVAVAWHARHRPIPVRTATGRGPRATQLLGLARRHRIAVHRDPALASALVSGDGPVPEAHWPVLADVMAAIRGRN